MSQDDKFLMILDKVNEVNERTIRMEEKVIGIEKDVDMIKEEDAEQNRLIAEHIAGVKTNTQRLELEKETRIQKQAALKERIDSLEEIPKFFNSLKKVLLYLAAIAGAVLTITKFLHFW